MNHPDEAEKALRAALKSDPQLAPAAYNLAVLLGDKNDLAGAVNGVARPTICGPKS